ncbi:hypothetical protein [Sebaldella sp. S0638]|nr:hypothetical protein [Sebaldella sp. S0638]MCP1226203.1 hypothetical protein [Sebaldella sp. S0638]
MAGNIILETSGKIAAKSLLPLLITGSLYTEGNPCFHGTDIYYNAF